jgi:hypothetical protein
MPDPRIFPLDMDPEEIETNLEAAREAIAKEAQEKAHALQHIEVHTDGNLTIATTNMGHVGWAKFNPNDKKLVWKKGKKKGTLKAEFASKYSPVAGQNLAIHRAVRKYFEQGA